MRHDTFNYSKLLEQYIVRSSIEVLFKINHRHLHAKFKNKTSIWN